MIRLFEVRIPERLQRPLRSSAFRNLALGRSVSFLGDWLMVAVLVGWVYESSDSVAKVALLLAIRMAPPIVGGGVAASLVDRFSRLKVLVWSEVACAATIAGSLVGVMIDSRPLVFVLVGLCGLGSMVSTVAGNALIPMTVAEDELPAANSVYAVGQEAAMALGALTGGITLALGGPVAGLAANLASYAVAVALYTRVPVVDAAREITSRAKSSVRQGLRYVFERRALAIVVSGVTVATLATGLVNATLPKFTMDLGLGAGGYGLALAAIAGGMIVGEAVTGAVAERIDARLLGIALAAMGCLLSAFAWSGTAALALAVLTAFGVANGVLEVVLMTAIHQEADGAYQGRVFGVASTIWRTSMLSAVVFAPVVNALASPPQAITVAAAFLFAGGVLVYVALRPRIHASPVTA
ncbi:MAG TPA: MFS transporter [Gaiellaceae bacterium]|nr:MFS transporter [Gaiellaceae bacterium]